MNDPALWMGLHRPDLPLAELDVGIVGAPYDGSVSHRGGAAQAPALLRALSRTIRPQTENLVSLRALRLRDLGDAPVAQGDPAATQQAIAAAVRPVAAAGAVPLVLGGDHSITSAAVAALDMVPNLGILWLDSHPDLMDRYRGPQGQVESPWNHACPLRRICELPNVRAENVLIAGLRDYIPAEMAYIRAHGIEVLSARDLGRLSPAAVVERMGKKFAGLPAVYISVDIDVLDPAYAPGTGVPIPGGISTRYLYDLFLELFDRERASLASSGRHSIRLAGLDLVEIAPPLDVAGMTGAAGLTLLSAMLGCVALQAGRAAEIGEDSPCPRS